MTTTRHITVPGGSFDLSARMAAPQGQPRALVIALHGGTYSSRYYDLAGAEHANALHTLAGLGYQVIAVDRPGYGGTAGLHGDATTFESQTEILAEAISRASAEQAPGLPVFLIGHSIGGMLALMVAARGVDAPLTGAMVCGMGVVWQPGIREMWASLISDAPAVDIPNEARHQVMFGPAGTYEPAVRDAHDADVNSMATSELTGAIGWAERMPEVGARVPVPVLLVLPEHDGIWSPSAQAQAQAADALKGSPRAVVAVQHASGHSVEAHRAAYAHHLAAAAFIEESVITGPQTAG